VKLVLETDGEGTTSFKRSIVCGRGEETYTSQYAVNERTVSWAAYEDKLKSFGILVKARNFLVFQVRHLKIGASSCSPLWLYCTPSPQDIVGISVIRGFVLLAGLTPTRLIGRLLM
jgi:hypothetical protein